jgi:hypothetical protein
MPHRIPGRKSNKKLIKSFCGCFTVQGAVFSKRAPCPPEAKKKKNVEK